MKIIVTSLKELIRTMGLNFSDNTVYYINGPETLPPPLSKEVEQKIMDKINID